MDTDLAPVAAALAEVDDDELVALIAAANGVPQFAPGLLAWIEHAADWEINRRRGLDFPLQPPEAAIDPSEDAISIDAAQHGTAPQPSSHGANQRFRPTPPVWLGSW